MSHQHPSPRTIVFRDQTPANHSDTTVVDQRPPPHRLTPIKRKPPRHQTGAAFTCLLTNHAYISAVLLQGGSEARPATLNGLGQDVVRAAATDASALSVRRRRRHLLWFLRKSMRCSRIGRGLFSARSKPSPGH